MAYTTGTVTETARLFHSTAKLNREKYNKSQSYVHSYRQQRLTKTVPETDPATDPHPFISHAQPTLAQ